MPEPPVRVQLPGAVAYSKKCELTPLTLYDVKQLSTVNDELSSYSVLVEVVQRRCSLPVEELIYPDFEYILHWLRLESYRNFRTTIDWTCGADGCGHKNSCIAEASSAYNLREDYRHGLKLSLSIGPTAVRLPLMKDVLALQENLRNKVPDLDNEIIRIAMMLEPSGGTLDERVAKVKELTADDEAAIRAFEADNTYGVKPTQNVVCEKCGNEQEVSTQTSMSRFLSPDDVSDDIRHRIYHDEAVPPADVAAAR